MGAYNPEIVLAHITDAHVAPYGRATTVLKPHSIAILNDIVSQALDARVQCAMFGGDNIDNRGYGREDLHAFAEIAERFDDYVCIVGNHEVSSPARGRIVREEFAARVAGRGIRPGNYNFVHSIGNVRIIGIDTTLQGTAGGYVSPATMQFLAAALHEGDEDHIVVLGHHLLYRAWEPLTLSSWDQEYLIANREHVTALLASASRVRVYLCGHHHASRIQRIASRGHHGGFYHILTSSPAAYPHTARILRFAEDGIHVHTIRPRIEGLLEEGRQAVLFGRKARRFGMLGSNHSFLDYVAGRPQDNDAVLPYDCAPRAEHRGVSTAGARAIAV